MNGGGAKGSLIQKKAIAEQRQETGICRHCNHTGLIVDFFNPKLRLCTAVCLQDKKRSAAKPEGPVLKVTIPRLSASECISSKAQKEKSHPQKVKSDHQKDKVEKAEKTAVPKHCDDWIAYVSRDDVTAAPISFFRHCPMADFFSGSRTDYTVEISNGTDNKEYFFATAVKMTGYRVKLRYIGSCHDTSQDVWHNICSTSVHPIGWAVGNRFTIAAPGHLARQRHDWRSFIIHSMANALALPMKFPEAVSFSVSNWPLQVGMTVEVADKTCLGKIRVAVVITASAGRLRLQYQDYEVADDLFSCHSHSALLHPVGWAQSVGHRLEASEEYKAETKNLNIFLMTVKKYATPHMFPKVPLVPKILDPKSQIQRFQVGMMLEVVDPLKLCNICVGSVHEVLGSDYLMIEVQTGDWGFDADSNRASQLVCHHMTSPYLLPVGFCKRHGLELTNPNKTDSGQSPSEFAWDTYLSTTRSKAAPAHLFCSEVPDHVFKVDMKLEAVDLMEPDFICIATIAATAGQLLLVHFDGWDSSFDQWTDCRSPDIYPIGWCELVGHPVQPIKTEGADELARKKAKNQKSKAKKRGRKRRACEEILDLIKGISDGIKENPFSIKQKADYKKEKSTDCDSA